MKKGKERVATKGLKKKARAPRAEPTEDGAEDEVEAARRFAAQLEKKRKVRDPAASAEAHKKARPAPADDAAPWTCELCDSTILVRPDGRARVQHLEGKAHRKKERVAAASSEQPKVRELFQCALCGCTGAASAQATHDGGKWHLERLQKLGALVPRLKRGDWLCCSPNHPFIQHNFAKSGRCSRNGCTAVRETQMGYEEAHTLAATVDHAPKPRPTAFGKVETLTCKDCGAEFDWGVKQQATCAAKGWPAPGRCNACRQARKA